MMLLFWYWLFFSFILFDVFQNYNQRSTVIRYLLTSQLSLSC